MPNPNECPDTALLYSAEDVARMAGVDRVAVVRLCLAGDMPEWHEFDGRRYWTRDAAKQAAEIARKSRGRRHAA